MHQIDFGWGSQCSPRPASWILRGPTSKVREGTKRREDRGKEERGKRERKKKRRVKRGKEKGREEEGAPQLKFLAMPLAAGNVSVSCMLSL